MNKKKFFSLLTAFMMAGATVSAFAGCSSAKLEKIEITTPPTKTTYIAGEKFDPAGMEVTATYSDKKEKVLKTNEWTYDLTEALKKSNRQVTVTYKEKDITKTATYNITVTNDIMKVEKLSEPTNLNYMLGQKFDATGMRVRLTYQDKTTAEKNVTDISSLVTYSNAGELTRNDKTFTVTVAGTPFTFTLNLDLRVFIEAENGLLNGKEPNQNSTNDGGNMGMDAALENAQTGAQSLYEAQLRATKKAELLEATPDMTDKDLQKALEDYAKTDAYKALVDAYLASPQFATDTAHYRASGDKYLGGVGQGDTVTFQFLSDKAGTGDIQFRLASAYLLKDNGNWGPVEMGDVQFNKLCEFYVNGVKYDIPDSVVLEGGKTADGSANGILWVNWKDVPFENIGFIAGRNSIELKILKHGIQSPAQPTYSWSANIDSLIIDSKTCTVDPFDNDTEITATPKSVTLAKEEDKAMLTVTGEISGTTGYLADKVLLTVGGENAEITMNGNAFTAKLDVTEFALDSYEIKLNGETVEISGMTGSEITIGRGIYRLAVESNVVGLEVDSTHKVSITEATLGTDIKLEVRYDKVYYVVANGSYKATVSGYESGSDEAKEAAAEALKEFFFTGFDNNPNHNGPSGWGNISTNTHEVTVAADNKFEIAIEITDKFLPPEGKDHRDLTAHIAPNSANTGNNGWNDYKPDVEAFTSEVTLGEYKYTLEYNKDKYYGTAGFTVTQATAPKMTESYVKLEAVEGKAYLVIVSAYENYKTADAAKAAAEAKFKDMQKLGGDWATQGNVKPVAAMTTAAEGVAKVYIDLSSLVAGADPYFVHFAGENQNMYTDLSKTEAELTVVVGTATYTLSKLSGFTGGDEWRNGLAVITVSAAAQA